MELLVCLVDKASDDPLHHPVLVKAGDVIHAAPDGAHWGREDLRNPDWKLLSVPGLSEDEAAALVGEELPQGPTGHEFILRPRGMRLDVAALGLRPGDRSGPVPDVTLDADRVRAAMTLKDPVPHPDLVGPPTSHTIG